jgi:hypothetical protein
MADTFSAHRRPLDDFREQAKYVNGACGLAVAVGGQVVACDLFDKPSTCQKVWDRLLSGYVLDALELKETKARAKSDDVERLLSGLTELSWDRAEPVGEGEEWRAQSDAGDQASALTCEETLVHGSVVCRV